MKKIVLFLHGYGSNGSDLITLKDYFHLDQSETEFISPNAPEPCEFNYFGWGRRIRRGRAMDSPEAPQVLNNVYQLSRQLSLTAPHEVVLPNYCTVPIITIEETHMIPGP